jgi:PPOX class probable F420-dependent enzyme
MQNEAVTRPAAALPPGLDRHKYLSLTTYRRDGRPVATPVWFVVDEGKIYVSTGESTGKVRRLRRDPRVTAGPSDGRGRLRGATFEAVASFVPAAEEPRVEAMFDRKYPVAKPVLLVLWRVVGLFRPRPAGREIILAIAPAGR